MGEQSPSAPRVRFPDPKGDVSSWLAWCKPNPEAHVRVFCLPYAGGGASVFNSWPDLMGPDVEICAIQLPGRETRIGEPPFTHLPPLVQTLAKMLQPYLERPFAIFGHSMGGLVGFELARQLRRQREPGPIRLVVSAHRAPQLPDPDPPIHELPDSAFLAKLQVLYGTPQNLLQDPELLQLCLPFLRADLAVCETYVYSADDPLDCPITVFGGLADPKVSREELMAWRGQTRRAFELLMIPGDHFFLQSARALMLDVLTQDLNRVSEPTTGGR